jgi:hypothetical protein
MLFYKVVLMHLQDKVVQKCGSHPARVARWYIFRPKTPLWANFGKPAHGYFGFIL